MFLLAKAFAEITGIVETSPQGDFGKWQIGAGKQVFGSFNFVDQHVLTGRLTGEMSEDAVELAFGIMAGCCEFLCGERCESFRVNEMERGFDARKGLGHADGIRDFIHHPCDASDHFLCVVCGEFVRDPPTQQSFRARHEPDAIRGGLSSFHDLTIFRSIASGNGDLMEIEVVHAHCSTACKAVKFFEARIAVNEFSVLVLHVKYDHRQMIEQMDHGSTTDMMFCMNHARILP